MVVVSTSTIEVTGDSYTHTVSGTTYTTTSNVLTNDKVGGVTATIASVTIHTSTPTTDKPYTRCTKRLGSYPKWYANGYTYDNLLYL